jgi:hypothetical protein
MVLPLDNRSARRDAIRPKRGSVLLNQRSRVTLALERPTTRTLELVLRRPIETTAVTGS